MHEGESRATVLVAFKTTPTVAAWLDENAKKDGLTRASVTRRMILREMARESRTESAA